MIMDSTGRAWVVVPRRPGPLLAAPGEVAERDDVDEFLDDLFGEPSLDRPGTADVVLVALGAAGLVAGLVGWLPSGVAVLGGLLLALGLVLPLTSLWRALGRRRQATSVSQLMGSGTLLATDHPLTAELVGAYRRILTRLDPDAEPPEALSAAHLALLEVAGLLHGRPPYGQAEEEYVARRAQAVADLAEDLDAARTAAAAQALAQGPLEEEVRAAKVQALEELETWMGDSSLDRLARLRRPRGTDPS